MVLRAFHKTIFRLRRHYLVLGLSRVRAGYWRGIGMQVGRGCKISNLVVTWPHRVCLGERCSLEHDVYLNAAGPYADGVAIAIGAETFIGSGCEFNATSAIRIGEACLIGSGSRFIDHNHGMGAGIMKQQEETQGAITVEPDVWIGANCVVLQGVTIGRGAVIGAGSVVTKDVAPFSIMVGVAARPVGHRADVVSLGGRPGRQRFEASVGLEAEASR